MSTRVKSAYTKAGESVFRNSAIRNPQSAITVARSFARDETGQGIIFAAASLVVLIGFVALVYNLGRVIERRTRIQIAADSAAYSGAMVQANALSTIGWINSAMAQVHYNAVKYAVNVNTTAVAARMELLQSGAASGIPVTPGPAYSAYLLALQTAQTGLPEAKRLMVQLSQTENAIAILTPRLLSEEMYAVGRRASGIPLPEAATEENATQADFRMTVYPSQRMFPGAGNTSSYRLEQFGNGWRITNLLGGNGEVLEVRLVTSDKWEITYSRDSITETEVAIERLEPNRWKVSFYDHGALVQEIFLVRTDDLGWVVWGRQVTPFGTTDLPQITFEPVDMDGDEVNEGTRVTCNGVVQVFKRGPQGDLYVWNPQLERYIDLTSSTTTIAGVEIQVNVTNVINFPGGGSAAIGDPTEVTIGNAHISLRDPPVIGTGLGPLWISMRGFDPDDFSVSVGGMSLGAGDADGVWRKWFDTIEELWHRQRLTQQEPEGDAERQWQYDHETLGAMLKQETNMDRYIYRHVFADRGYSTDALPDWTAWFNPAARIPAPRPENFTFSHTWPNRQPGDYDPIQPNEDPPVTAYYLTQSCPLIPIGCGGRGWVDVPNDPNNPAMGTHREICPLCQGHDHDRDGVSDLRVFIGDVVKDDYINNTYMGNRQRGLQETDYMDSRVYPAGAYGVPASAGHPLVLTEEFFKYGVNVGTWRSKDTPMIFPDKYQPAWGYVALSSARVGVPDDTLLEGVRYNFTEDECRAGDRQYWVERNSNNLYVADISARLFPMSEQVNDYDLDRDLLQGIAVTADTENGLSYLWDTLLSAGYSYPYHSNGWLDQFDGRSDPQVGAALRNMTNRAGNRFDYGNRDVEEVVEH